MNKRLTKCTALWTALLLLIFTGASPEAKTTGKVSAALTRKMRYIERKIIAQDHAGTAIPTLRAGLQMPRRTTNGAFGPPEVRRKANARPDAGQS